MVWTEHIRAKDQLFQRKFVTFCHAAGSISALAPTCEEAFSLAVNEQCLKSELKCHATAKFCHLHFCTLNEVVYFLENICGLITIVCETM